MDDGKLEKVIKGLEHCVNNDDCRGCVYFEEYSKIIHCGCGRDALELLKKIEKPRFIAYADGRIEPIPKIVRCRDCKHIGYTNSHWFCKMLSRCVDEDWFCADGELAEKNVII